MLQPKIQHMENRAKPSLTFMALSLLRIPLHCLTGSLTTLRNILRTNFHRQSSIQFMILNHFKVRTVYWSVLLTANADVSMLIGNANKYPTQQSSTAQMAENHIGLGRYGLENPLDLRKFLQN